MPYLRAADTKSIRETIYTEIFLKQPAKRGAVAIRDQRYKLIRDHWFGDVEYELYDLQRDPFERHDLLAVGHCGSETYTTYCRLRGEIEGLWASERAAMLAK